jgi:uncharacterized protein (UPF0261 family)
VVVVDAGVLGEPLFAPDVSRSEVAHAAGVDVEDLAAARDKGAAIQAMARGAGEIVERLQNEGRLGALGGLGGTGGSAIVAEAMRRLPIGVAKLLVSTVVSGDTSAYVGVTDATLMYSVVDIAGLNRVLAPILDNAAAAIAGMARARLRPRAPAELRPLVAASMFGVTTPCVTRARERLEELGYEVLVFHQTGAGGRAMEELIRAGFVTASLDVTTTELCDELAGGVWPAVPERLETAGAVGIPQVVSLGALDMVNVGPLAELPGRFRDRTLYEHSPAMTLARTTADEASALGATIARKLNRAHGPTALFCPLQGLSLLSIEGGVFHDAAADAALLAALRERVDRSRVELHEVDCDVNDPDFALAMADRLHELYRDWQRP